MSAREEILSLMNELGVEPKKSLGQNFLISDHVIEKILNAVEKLKPTSMIEVGPGLGALTRGLLKMKVPFSVIELDRVFAKYWREKEIDVHEADALQFDWSTLKLSENAILVSNLPYQISSSLVIDRSLDIQQLSAMVLMFQKEVAQRLKANKGHELYGMLSVFAQTFWQIETLLEASSGDFMPPPKVASRVLVFQRKNHGIADKKKYLQMIKGSFLHPRKLLVSNLSTSLGMQKNALVEKLVELGLSEKVRAEELDLQQFLALYHSLGYR